MVAKLIMLYFMPADVCPSGYYKVGTISCEPCPTGTYKDNAIDRFGSCQQCPYQTTTSGTGTTSLAFCTVSSTVITNLTFTIRMTEMNFTDDLKNSSSVIYHTTRNKLVQTLDMLLGQFQGYSGALLLSFRRGSVKADVKVSVNQFGNISTIQAVLKQSVSLGFIGLNGTTIAVDSTYFISYIREGYTILDGIDITNAGDIYNGSSINITCMTTLIGNATPSIVWKYNGNDINPVTGSRIRISTTLVDLETLQIINKTVTFDQLQSSDSGTYECVVLDGNSSPSVMNMTVFVLSQPEVFIQPVTQTVDVGSNVSISCQVVNDVPITQMVWYRNGTEINSTNQLSEENISFGNTTSILTHKNIQYTTKYECRGDNAAGQGNMRQAMIYVALSWPHHDETCTNETDKRGIKWSITLQGKYDSKPCPTGMSGEAVRYCSQGGVWRDPSYDNCINETLLALQILTDNIKNGLSPNTVQDSLVNLTHVTNPDNVELQKAEVQIVSTILDNVVQISNHTDNITNKEIENFLEIASNVIDVKNRPSWEALISKDQVGASIILRNVEQYSSIKAKSTNSPDETVKRFTKKNLFVEIGYNLVGDIQFPNTTSYGSAFNNSSSSRFVLSQDALKNGNYTSYAGAYFNNVSGIVQKNLLHEGSILNTGDNLEINSAVLSLQLDPKPPSLSPPLILTFKHFSFSREFNIPLSSSWSSLNTCYYPFSGHGNGSWSGEGCKLVSTSDDTTVCQCDHLTNFAILMSPGKTPTKNQVSLSIISIIGCAISIFCLSVTMVAHLIVWRYVKSARSHLLMNLCAALIISYIIFLAGIDQTENKNACTAVAALLHYFYLSVFFLMLAFGIEIAVSVIYVFVTSSRIRWLLPIAWILPAVIVAISLGVTKLKGYGNEKFCWLSIEDGLIWAFVGPAALVILINFIIIIVVFHRMFSSSSMLTKSDKVKAKTAVRSLCVLLPITGITWVFGILSVNEDLVVFQYLFTIINSLQGLFIFLFNCVFNHHLKEAIKQMNASRKRSQVPVSTTLSNSSHSSGPKTRVTLDEDQKNKASDLEGSSTNSFLGSDRQMEKQIETYAKDDQLNTEYEESGTRIKDKRCGYNSSIQDVKISNILHDPKVRRERDHAQVATSSTTRANANTSANIDAGDPTNFREKEMEKYVMQGKLKFPSDVM
ncbi:hypothetical protein ACJMK2_034834 [Sinanodonta woodiana]|uniref:Uncharacterized protein n=1 Tax=Sinanodonta woodiana TaxID=1069815 RepID=A0ABD3WT10_SINWO